MPGSGAKWCSDPVMCVGSKERILDLENTWEIYRGFIAPGRCKHGSFLAGAMQEGRRDIHKNKRLRA